MNDEIYNKKMEQFISEAYASLSPETLRQFDEETIDQLAKAAYIGRVKAEAERDPEFREYITLQGAQDLVNQYLENLRPGTIGRTA